MCDRQPVFRTRTATNNTDITGADVGRSARMRVTIKMTVHAAYVRYFTPPPNKLVSTASLNKFVGTTNEQSLLNSSVTPARDHYVDVGISQQFRSAFNVGLDTFYKYSRDILDEGQLGSALI